MRKLVKIVRTEPMMDRDGKLGKCGWAVVHAAGAYDYDPRGSPVLCTFSSKSLAVDFAERVNDAWLCCGEP